MDEVHQPGQRGLGIGGDGDGHTDLKRYLPQLLATPDQQGGHGALPLGLECGDRSGGDRWVVLPVDQDEGGGEGSISLLTTHSTLHSRNPHSTGRRCPRGDSPRVRLRGRSFGDKLLPDFEG